MSKLDLIFRHGLIIDGSGSPGYIDDVGIKDGYIKLIGNLRDIQAERVIDIEGCILSPGFVDVHTHSDIQLLSNPRAEQKVMQGVTTEVIGQDGLSFAPVNSRTLDAIKEQTIAWNGNPDNIDWNWKSVAEYLEKFKDHSSVNVAYLIPHGTIRMLVMGDKNRSPSELELKEMCYHIRKGIKEGAVGLSTGLSYSPAMYATTGELIELCKEVFNNGGFFSPHLRSYGKGALDSYEEALTIHQETRVSLHLTHCLLNFQINIGRARDLISLINKYQHNAHDVTLDSYPYTAGSTYLASFLPAWCIEKGLDSVLGCLHDRDNIERLRNLFERTGTIGSNHLPIEWNKVIVSSVSCPDNYKFIGKSFQEIAQVIKCDPFDVAIRLLIDERFGINILYDVGNEANIRSIMKLKNHMPASDGILIGQKPHPRGWGTFARYLAQYTRNLEIFTWEEIIKKMTFLPNSLLRQKNRGMVRPNYFADVVVFNPSTIMDNATYDDPKRYPDGISFVVINGEIVVEQGVHSGKFPGKVLNL